jgi:hypothetical protein
VTPTADIALSMSISVRNLRAWKHQLPTLIELALALFFGHAPVSLQHATWHVVRLMGSKHIAHNLRRRPRYVALLGFDFLPFRLGLFCSDLREQLGILKVKSMTGSSQYRQWARTPITCKPNGVINGLSMQHI